ncbi:methyl-accepting chemotaxis protein [Dechloromonas sp. HYN0024]|uniref:methyl-accepting chemotaxis protein n=1 Tax=Dechloromonas sp. HYN0024 TaxID=2231055 RepID=UPI000E434440|nr:methyl-accepting chemotaxis protein [Dechloromonas sp. HYN0024]AXS78634.1 methyl-accepting chemotaxis protein [Dechloromonas sp. HYN0024]
MSFRNRLLLGMALIMAAFITAVVVANSGLRSTSARFGSFLDGIGALQHGYQDMYSQGLQMGQALRNCVLDPTNPKAYENLEKARKDFSAARNSATQAASSVDGFTSSLARLGPLAQAQADAQGEVLAALKAGHLDEAKALVNSKETPAWRSLKKALLDDLEVIDKATNTQRQEVASKAEQIQNIALVLSALAIIVGIASVVTMLAYVRRELGGEPGYARQVANAVATGDLTQPITLAHGDRDSLLAGLAAMQAQLRELVGSLAGHARDVAQTAVQMATATSHVANGNDQQLAVARSMVSNGQSIFASLQEVMGAVKEAETIAHNSSEISGSGAALAGKAAEETKSMAASVQVTAQHIRELNTLSTQINSILGVISDIAGQTNLLALNAAIEAARAGEQGRGFAVVADEVRKLAERTSKSTAEISAMVESIHAGTSRAAQAMEAGIHQVDESVQLSNQAREAFDRMNGSSLEVREVVARITESISLEYKNESEMQTHIEQARKLIEDGARAMQGVVASAERLKTMSDALSQQVSRFTL